MSNPPCNIDTCAQNPYKTCPYRGALPETDCRGADVTAEQERQILAEVAAKDAVLRAEAAAMFSA
jgi:hypothetical protein